MRKCGCGWPLSITGKGEICTSCDLRSGRLRAGRCLDCGTRPAEIGVYCRSCFAEWHEVFEVGMAAAEGSL